MSYGIENVSKDTMHSRSDITLAFHATIVGMQHMVRPTELLCALQATMSLIRTNCALTDPGRGQGG